MKPRAPYFSAITNATTTFRELKVLAAYENANMDIYLRYPDGSNHYLMTRHWNCYLWALLKDDGIFIDELRRLQPKRSPRKHNYYDSVRYLLKIVDSLFKYQTAAKFIRRKVKHYE